MNPLQIYRKRLLPAGCLLLKDDIIVEANKEVVITKWNTLNPKTTFDHGCSCYFLEEGIKVNVWTVDDPARAEELISWGVQFITSNILE